MTWPISAYYILRTKIVKDHLDKYPDSGSKTIARILFRDYPEYFTSLENARDIIRHWRGQKGSQRLSKLKDRKYVKVQPSGKF